MQCTRVRRDASICTIQHRLDVLHPQRAIVLGAGPLGLWATMALHVRGLELVALARRPGTDNIVYDIIITGTGGQDLCPCWSATA